MNTTSKAPVQAILKTSMGDITLEVYPADAPKTVDNFLKLARQGFYNGTKFHRVIKDFMIQGGDPLSKDDSKKEFWGTGGPGYQFEDEINARKIVRGSLAMANSGEDTNGSQFFIVTAEATPWLDGKHTNFGEVVAGMDAVNAIGVVKTDEADRPLKDIIIQEITLRNVYQVTNTPMRITSSAFSHNASIPSRYTCDGDDINPPLEFVEVPPGAKSFALIVDDPDAPVGLWVHWTVWNIAPDTRSIAEKAVPLGAVEGITSFGRAGWGGPCPPSGTHRYFFKLYVLDIVLDVPSSTDKAALEQAMDGHILARAELIGLYSRR